MASANAAMIMIGTWMTVYRITLPTPLQNSGDVTAYRKFSSPTN